MCTSQRHYKCNSRIELYCGQTQTGVQKYCIHRRPQGGGTRVGARPPPPRKIPKIFGYFFSTWGLSPRFPPYVGPFCYYFPHAGAFLQRFSLWGRGGGAFQTCGGVFNHVGAISLLFLSMLWPLLSLWGAFLGFAGPYKNFCGCPCIHRLERHNKKLFV